VEQALEKLSPDDRKREALTNLKSSLEKALALNADYNATVKPADMTPAETTVLKVVRLK
jgi:hypothetical protein